MIEQPVAAEIMKLWKNVEKYQFSEILILVAKMEDILKNKTGKWKFLSTIILIHIEIPQK